MARRHFNSEGFPKLDEIIKEICNYVDGLEVEYDQESFIGNVYNRKKIKYSGRLIGEDVEFTRKVSKNPFKVNGIYVVGGQVSYLPESYNKGEHDLDLIIRTNASKLTHFSQVEVNIWDHLSKMLNDGKGDILERKKEFSIDLNYENENNKLIPPYLQIYPELKKIEK